VIIFYLIVPPMPWKILGMIVQKKLIPGKRKENIQKYRRMGWIGGIGGSSIEG
jgi:hypothetical protein